MARSHTGAEPAIHTKPMSAVNAYLEAHAPIPMMNGFESLFVQEKFRVGQWVVKDKIWCIAQVLVQVFVLVLIGRDH